MAQKLQLYGTGFKLRVSFGSNRMLVFCYPGMERYGLLPPLRNRYPPSQKSLSLPSKATLARCNRLLHAIDSAWRYKFTMTISSEAEESVCLVPPVIVGSGYKGFVPFRVRPGVPFEFFFVSHKQESDLLAGAQIIMAVRILK